MTFSVAVCTYNGAKYVEEQLISILNQELPVSEIVICDDGSKDDTLTIVQRIADNHPEVNWVVNQNSPNLGVTRNFEKAIRLCTGDIVFLADQDDVWHKNKTRIINNYFEANSDKNVVFTDANLIGGNGELLTMHSLFDSVLLLPYFYLWEDGLQFEILNVWYVATGATMAFRKSFVNQFLPFVEKKEFLHDYQIAVKACLNNSLGIIKERLIDYRQHSNNVIGVKRDSWVYSGEKTPSLLAKVVEPHNINCFFRKWENNRTTFYIKRYRNYHTVMGKVRLFLSLFSYLKFYKRSWLTFFASDLLYGVNAKMRLWVVNRR